MEKTQITLKREAEEKINEILFDLRSELETIERKSCNDWSNVILEINIMKEWSPKIEILIK